MFDIGISEIFVIGVVALVVIGPERLPRVAKTMGHLFGRLQRYVTEVKADINREIELDEIRRLQSTVQDAARSVEQTIGSQVNFIESEVKQAGSAVEKQVDEAVAPMRGIQLMPHQPTPGVVPQSGSVESATSEALPAIPEAAGDRVVVAGHAEKS